MSLTKKILLTVLILTFVPLIYTFYTSYQAAKQAIEKEALEKLSVIAQRQENRITDILRIREEKITLISNNSELSSVLNLYIQNKSLSELQKINNILVDAKQDVSSIKHILFLDTKGRVLASTDPELIGKDFSTEEFFIKGKNENVVNIQNIYEDNSAEGVSSMPIKFNSNLIGILSIKTNSSYLFNTVQDYTGLGTTGEVIIAKRNSNGTPVLIVPLRFDTDGTFKRTVETSYEPIYSALSGNNKLFIDEVDYRGKHVLSVTRYLQKPDWGIVVKMDKDEVFAPVYRMRTIFILNFILILVAVSLIAIFFGRTITKPLNKLQHIAEELRKGNLMERAPESQDEIGQLGKTLNNMAIELEVAFNLLRDKHKESELYKRKTNELTKSNKKLEDELVQVDTLQSLLRVEEEIKEIKNKIGEK